MKTIKIYGKTYTVHKQCKREPTLFWHDGNLTDEPLNRKPDGYIKMEDNSIVGVYGKKNMFVAIAAAVLLIAVGSGGYLVYTNISRPTTLSGTYVKVSQPGNNEINFNTFVQCDGDKADIRFTNGQSKVQISVTGEGIESKSVVVNEGESMATIPMRYTTKEAAVEAQLTVKQDGTTYNYPIIVEIPNNMTNAGGSVNAGVELYTTEDHPLSEEALIQ